MPSSWRLEDFLTAERRWGHRSRWRPPPVTGGKRRRKTVPSLDRTTAGDSRGVATFENWAGIRCDLPPVRGGASPFITALTCLNSRSKVGTSTGPWGGSKGVKMRRPVLLVYLVVTMLLLTTSAALAGPDQNPTAIPNSDLSCENGITADTFLAVGRTGHISTAAEGVATSITILSGPAAGTTIFDVGGGGLDGLTVWCEWTDVDSGLLLGGQILFRGNLR
jgi:hypothetical protein